MKKERVEWIDIIKGIGILLMVIGHAGNIPNAKLWIYCFHMPLFFIMAGYVYGKFSIEKYRIIGIKSLIFRNYKSYLVPYIVLFFINFIIFETLLFIRDGGKTANISRYLLNGFLYSYDTDLPNCDPLWFLTCLFISYIYFWTILKSRKRYVQVLNVCACLVLSVLVVRVEKIYNIDELPWHVDVAFVACLFMYVGYLYCVFRETIAAVKTRCIFLLCFLAVLMGSLIGIMNGRINMVKNQYQNIFMFIFGAILIVYAIMIFVQDTHFYWNDRIKSIFRFWGQNTLVFMGFNYFFNLVLRQIFVRLSLENSIWYSIFDVIVVLIGCSLIIKLWHIIKRVFDLQRV